MLGPKLTDASNAFALSLSYHELPEQTQQSIPRMSYLKDYSAYCIEHCIPYASLTEELRKSAFSSEKRYLEALMFGRKHQLRLYPYNLIDAVVYNLHETPLRYYTSMLKDMMVRSERSYDNLPNFTAIDVLNLLGIGRNQYLELVKQVKGRMLWKFSKNMAKIDVTPFLDAKAQLEPLVVVHPVSQNRPMSDVKKDIEGLIDAGALGSDVSAHKVTLTSLMDTYKQLVMLEKGINKGAASATSASNTSFTAATNEGDEGTAQWPFCLACQFPKDEVTVLYRMDLVYYVIPIDDRETFTIPPLGNFVMNRTSDDAQEQLLYKLLVTLDERTNLEMLSGLLNTPVDRICAAASLYLRLGLAKRMSYRYLAMMMYGSSSGAQEHSAGMAFHETWTADIAELKHSGLLPRGTFRRSGKKSRRKKSPTTSEAARKKSGRKKSPTTSEAARSGSAANGEEDGGGDAAVAPEDDDDEEEECSSSSEIGTPTSAPGHPGHRIALLFDSSLAGTLMMANVACQGPSNFKQHAVTMFEAGKLTFESLPPFMEMLDSVSDVDGLATACDETAQYFESLYCLRDILRAFVQEKATLNAPGCNHGEVDMLKIEAINELEPTVRYSVLCRKYGMFLVLSPTMVAPLLDSCLPGVYGTTITLMPSAWLLLYAYTLCKCGPRCVLYKCGTRVRTLPLRQLGPFNSEDAYLLLHEVRNTTSDSAVAQGAMGAQQFRCRTGLMQLNDVLTHAPVLLMQACNKGATATDGAEQHRHKAGTSITIEVPFTLVAHEEQQQSTTTSEAISTDAAVEEEIGADEERAQETETKCHTKCHDVLLQVIRSAVEKEVSAGSDDRHTEAQTEDLHVRIADDLYRQHRLLVDALKLGCSLGYVVFEVYIEGSLPSAATVSVVDVQFGLAKHNHVLCTLMLQQARDAQLFTDAAMDFHTEAMKHLASAVTAFSEKWGGTWDAPATSLQSWRDNPMLSKAGGVGNHWRLPPPSQIPFPTRSLFYDGTELHFLD